MLAVLLLLTSLLTHAQELGLWVWSQEHYYGGSIATDSLEQQRFFAFIDKNKFKHIYLDSTRLFVTQARAKALENLIAKAKKREVKTELLFGSIHWLDEDKLEEIKHWFESSIFAQLTKFKTLPDAIHLDIEPQARDDWDTNREVLIQNWLSLTQHISKLAHDNGIKLTVDIPFYFDEPTLVRINDFADKVVVMVYRTKFSGGNSITDLTEEERRIFQNKLVIGLETSSDDQKLSFNQDPKKLQEIMSEIYKEFQLDVALHQYESLKNLLLHRSRY